MHVNKDQNGVLEPLTVWWEEVEEGTMVRRGDFRGKQTSQKERKKRKRVNTNSMNVPVLLWNVCL